MRIAALHRSDWQSFGLKGWISYKIIGCNSTGRLQQKAALDFQERLIAGIAVSTY
jgi:hypothetical protein